MSLDLPVLWAFIVGLGVFLYVMLDGFDLGLGLLFPFFDARSERQVMLNTVAPVWDGNETFLVLGGAVLYGAFPVAYATLLPANYLPLVLMVIGLIFRGAAFELRAKARRTQNLWDLAFIGGSMLATFCQGVVLGSLLQGTTIVNGAFAGDPFGWLSPFSVFCGFCLLITYAALGCGWIIWKTEGALQEKAYFLMKPLCLLLLGAIFLVSAWTVIGLPAVAERWLSGAHLIVFSPVPILVLACATGIVRAVNRRRDVQPFVLTLAILFLGYSGLVISMWPNLVPPSLSIWDASSPPESQWFILVGTVIVLPIILVYNFMQYRVFHGKVREGDAGYH
ncbi:MAG: cytochrome d ubiquinol oxidase subunit II [Burkholderia sp.]